MQQRVRKQTSEGQGDAAVYQTRKHRLSASHDRPRQLQKRAVHDSLALHRWYRVTELAALDGISKAVAACSGELCTTRKLVLNLLLTWTATPLYCLHHNIINMLAVGLNT